MALLVVCSTIAAAPSRADVLVLKNGDRISGKIKRIWDAEVSIDPDYADEFQVKTSAVEYIESDREFDVELADGTEMMANFDGAGADGAQRVKSADQTVSVPLENLFEVDEPEADFEIESHIDLSGTINTGNTDTLDTKLRGDLTVRINDHRNIGEVTFFREEVEGVSTQEQDLFKYSYNYLFREPWFFTADLTYESDPIMELDSRVIGSAGIGVDLWNTPRRTLSIQLGAGMQTEEIAEESEDSAVANWTLRYQQDFFRDDLELFHNHSITHNLSGRTNTSYKSSTGVRYEITDLFYGNVSVDFDYESDPAEDAENEDVTFVFGVGLEF
jgi:putative salt-induced outer membrane protein YdiY